MAAEITPSQTAGPFLAIGLCNRELSEVVPPDTAGAIRIVGRVLDGAGDPVPDSAVEIWQADSDGIYRSQFGWGRCGADEDGHYSLTTVKPGSVADDGVAQAPHLVVMVFARGLLKQVLTRMYFPEEEAANSSDPVLSAIADEQARASLIAERHGSEYRFDIRLQGADQTAFFSW